MAINWKKGRGKLGLFAPLIGRWRAESDSELGAVVCIRTFAPVLGGAYIQLNADWVYAKGGYQELAMIGVNPDGNIAFWSFTSDKKQSQGTLARADDVHAQSICFEAQMPAGLARMIYWPHEDSGFNWVVESKNAKGWHRFLHHQYLRLEG